MKWFTLVLISILGLMLIQSTAYAAGGVRECSAFRPNREPEYLHCPSDIFIRHANGVEDFNISNNEVVTLVGRKLPANTDIFFQVACAGYYQEPAHSDANGVAVFNNCTAVVDPSPGAMNCGFIYFQSPKDGLFHTIAYQELTPV